MSNVLVLFQADTEATEQQALAVAVGAVEGGASIRLRRLARPGAPELGHKDYGTLKPADLTWADTLAILLESAGSADRAAEASELKLLLDLPPLAGKYAWVSAPDSSLLASLRNAGIVLLPDAIPGSNAPAETEAVKQIGRLCANPPQNS